MSALIQGAAAGSWAATVAIFAVCGLLAFIAFLVYLIVDGVFNGR